MASDGSKVVRWADRQLRRLAEPALAVPPLEQSAAQRARVDTSAWATKAPIRFGLLTAASGAGAAVAAVALASDLALASQIAAGVAGGVAGFLLPVGVIFAAAWVAAFPRQRNEARHAIKVRSTTQDQAYADALRLRGEVDRRTRFAQGWLGDELALEQLRSAAVPMPTWDASRFVFGEVLAPDAWRAFVSEMEEFNADWERLLAVAQRSGPMGVDEHKALLTDLRTASEAVIAKSKQIHASLHPLLEHGGSS